MTTPGERLSTEIRALVESMLDALTDPRKNYGDAKSALLAALGALEEDKKRLEWLTGYPRSDGPKRWEAVWVAWHKQHPNGACVTQESIRAAIDTALNAGDSNGR